MTTYKIEKVTFDKPEDFRPWRTKWRANYKQLSSDIRKHKRLVKHLQRQGRGQNEQRQLRFMRIMAYKMMLLLEEAKKEYQAKKESMKQLAEHMEQFPINYPKCREVIFHFNKGHMKNPAIPVWVLKAKGKTFYVNHVNATIPWSTKEVIGHPSTIGSIKFKKASMYIDEDGCATVGEAK